MRTYTIEQARDALTAAGITGPHRSHARADNIAKIHALLDHDSEAAFGLSCATKYPADEVLAFVSQLTGCPPGIDDLTSADLIDPDRTVAAIVEAAGRLRDEALRGATLLAATGHPTGMLEHDARVVDAYCRAGGKLLRLREGESFTDERGRHAEVRYVGGVGCASDWGNLKHTHSSRYMEWLLESDPWPDIVLGDHGFAGAAIERGIPTIAVMDINDPALAVAWAEGHDVVVIPMDDNRRPRHYRPSWSLFEQILSGHTPAGG